MTKAIRWSDDELEAYKLRGKMPKPVPKPAIKDLAPRPAIDVPKFRNKKVEADGIVHDSGKEARRWTELQRQQATGEITDLKRQVKFELIPAQRRADGKAERACAYFADFVYEKSKMRVVEDVKGMKTKDYIIKRKLMLKIHDITITEI